MRVRAGPSGIQMFDRATGLNVLFDEISVPPALWATSPRYVSIALTNACDLACSYCYAPKDAAALDVERVVGWLDELDRNGCLGVGFGGGEPTLHPGLAEICRYATKNTGLAVTLTTHGHRFDDALRAALTGSIHFVRVSMDGVGPTYEALRGRSFTVLRRRLETIRSLARFGINYVVNARTFPDLTAGVQFAAEMGAAEFLLLPEQPTRNSCGIDSQTTRALRQWVSLYSGMVPLSVSEVGADGLPTCDPLERETGLRAYAFIGASGTLKRSSFDVDGIPVGERGLMRALDVLRISCREGQK
ncbi:MAG: radical SAM protein [Acidobacteriia bacterium]|nr:radical SAM protein [Terriglobia bacterium]